MDGWREGGNERWMNGWVGGWVGGQSVQMQFKHKKIKGNKVTQRGIKNDGSKYST